MPHKKFITPGEYSALSPTELIILKSQDLMAKNLMEDQDDSCCAGGGQAKNDQQVRHKDVLGKRLGFAKRNTAK